MTFRLITGGKLVGNEPIEPVATVTAGFVVTRLGGRLVCVTVPLYAKL